MRRKKVVSLLIAIEMGFCVDGCVWCDEGICFEVVIILSIELM